MIPYILAAVGGYLIGDSLKGKQFAEGGMMAKGGMLEVGDMVHIPSENKSGVVVNIISNGKHYTVKFPDGSKIVYDKNELERVNEMADGGYMARGGLTGRDKKLLDAGFRLTIITDMYNHKIIIEKNKKTNKIEYIVIEGDIFSKHKKLKEFDTESEAFSYLSTKAGRKVKQAVD